MEGVSRANASAHLDKPSGLIELYEMRLPRFMADDVSIAGSLTSQAVWRLDAVSSGDVPLRRAAVYPLPPPGSRGIPRTR